MSSTWNTCHVCELMYVYTKKVKLTSTIKVPGCKDKHNLVAICVGLFGMG